MLRTSMVASIVVSLLLPLSRMSAQPATASETAAPSPGGSPSKNNNCGACGNNAAHAAPSPGGASSGGGSIYGNNASHAAPSPGGMGVNTGSTYGDNAETAAPAPGGMPSGGSTTYGNNASHAAPAPGGGGGGLKATTLVPAKVFTGGGSKGTKTTGTGTWSTKGPKTGGNALTIGNNSKWLKPLTPTNHPNDSAHKHPAH